MRIFFFTILILQIGISSWAQEMSYLMIERERLSVTQSELQDAVSLIDIHPRYCADWVASYFSVDIQVTDDDEIVSARSANDVLSKEQKSILKNAAVGSEVNVVVKYMPDNNLRHNTAKEMQYTYTVLPAVLAEFIGGEDLLNTYIDHNILAKLDSAQEEMLKISKISFSIATTGRIEEVKLLEPSGNEAIDAILLNGICEMPNWKPAQKSDGTPAKQIMKFYISNTKGSCLMN